MASTSRLLKIIGLICKRALEKRLYSAKETYDFKEPANGSHPIPTYNTTTPHTPHTIPGLDVSTSLGFRVESFEIRFKVTPYKTLDSRHSAYK